MLGTSRSKSIKNYRLYHQTAKQDKISKFMPSQLLTWIKLLISCFKLTMKNMVYGCLFFGFSCRIIKISTCPLKIKRYQSFLTDNSRVTILQEQLCHLFLEVWIQLHNGPIFMEKVNLALATSNLYGKWMSLGFNPIPNGLIF